MRLHPRPTLFPYTTLFRSILGRTPSQTEVNNWVTALNNGETTEQVAYGFAASAEREGNRVRGDYQTFLGRMPTQAEVNSWVKMGRAARTDEGLVSGVGASTEY